MPDNYIIEIRPKSVGITVQAGIVVREGRRFRFYAATHTFNSLEGQLFKSPRAAEWAAIRHIVDKATRNPFGCTYLVREQGPIAGLHWCE